MRISLTTNFLNIGAVGARLDDQDIAAMIQEADVDGNGEISFDGEPPFIFRDNY
jgi:Ca2+-binding EF-hand superfamily protein